MPVRYVNFFQSFKSGIEVFANRGTSGIDGSVSTAVGMSQHDKRQHILIIGDLSLYYDRNGLWHNYLPNNFKIVVMNNQGGGIFSRIEGPMKQPELQEYFISTQPTNFEALAASHGFEYVKAAVTTLFKDLLSLDKRLLIEVVL
jgi:2-succinyl-5-enolpyruvyl-6-hydroxy-3-cyclohexene-1-carboxylate synthase